MTQPVWGEYPKKIKAYVHTKMYTQFFIEVWLTHNIALASGAYTNVYSNFVCREGKAGRRGDQKSQ